MAPSYDPKGGRMLTQKEFPKRTELEAELSKGLDILESES
jgi:hypothetical protein